MNTLLLWLALSASFSANCPTTRCTFDASASGPGVVKYVWDYGIVGKAPESHVGATANQIFPKPGQYSILLTVTDGSGASASIRQLVTVPNVRVDTLRVGAIVHDTVTIRLPGVVVHDTIVKTLPGPVIHDTVKVSVPGPVVHDTIKTTITITVHDTVRVYVPATTPPPTGGRTITQPSPGTWLVWQGATFIGQLVIYDLSLDTWMAYQATPGQMSMPCLGFPTCTIFPNQAAAAAALR